MISVIDPNIMSGYLGQLLNTYIGSSIFLKIIGNFEISGKVMEMDSDHSLVEIHDMWKVYFVPLCNIIFVNVSDCVKGFLENVKDDLSDFGLPDHVKRLIAQIKLSLNSCLEKPNVWLNCVNGENYIEDILDVIPGLFFSKDRIFIMSHIMALRFDNKDDGF